MRISAQNQRSRCRRPAVRRGERGFLVIALLAIVAIMLIYVNVNVRLLGNLKRELKLVEQQQIQRLEKIGAQPLRLTTPPNSCNGAYVNVDQVITNYSAHQPTARFSLSFR